MGMRDYLSLAATAAALALALTPLLRRLAVRIGAIDQPDGRRVHVSAVPRLGGLAIVGAVLGAVLLSPLLGVDVAALLVVRDWHLGWLLAGVFTVVAAGVWDDLHGLAPLAKLGLVLIAALAALAGDFGLHGFTDPLSGTYVTFGALGGLVTLVWIVAVTNAFNLVDGLDGLASGVALLAAVTLLAVSLLEGRQEAALLWAVIGGALAGFLPYNFFPATIFLGDSGSLFLGYALAVLAVQSLEKSATLVIVLVPVLALGLPVIEIGLTVLRRASTRGVTALFRADRDHIHHRLLGSGLSHRRAVLTLYALCAALGAFAFLAVVVQGPWNAVLVGVTSVASFAAIRRLAYGKLAAPYPSHERKRRVAVVVLGDLGRSPRMLYHAQSLAEAGAEVELIGYCETELPRAIRDCAAIHVSPLPVAAASPPGAPFVLHGALRVARQSLELFAVLGGLDVDTILVQNPPAVPTLFIALIGARAGRARLVVDWHNFGWSMLALRLGASHWLVRIARRWEEVLGRRADAHLCVSQAMAGELARTNGVVALVLRDLPAKRFVPLPAPQRAAGRERVVALCGAAASAALVVAPTGWTADEDVDLLLDTARLLDERIAGADDVCAVAIVATGRGPRRAEWERRAAALSLRHVRICARWLSADEYPAFLAAADVGVSVHRSASGLDLPMKIADLLGAGVPVCALAYAPCLAEALRDGVTGLLFADAEELATQLLTLLRSARDRHGPLAQLRHGVERVSGARWDEAWCAVARPLLLP